MTWKIKNISKVPVKVSIALGGANNPGVILQPGEMVLSIDRLTGPLDAQERRKVVEVDRDFDNEEWELPLGEVLMDISDAERQVEKYILKNK